MVTQKAEETIYGTMHGHACTVDLGADLDGNPAVMAVIPTNAWNTTSLAFNNPLILRDLAADLNAAAKYLEDEKAKRVGS